MDPSGAPPFMASRRISHLKGARSAVSQMNWQQRIWWAIRTPIRTLICISNVTIFFITYFGFMFPVMWASKVWPRLYWFWEGKLYRWLQAFLGYWGYTAGYDVYEYGDDLAQCIGERVLLMSNHQSTADVPTLMACLQHKGVASRKTLWLMDMMFRWTPFGIIGNIHGDYFIQQGKAGRDKELVRLKDHLKNVFWERDRRWVILFPEGGFYFKRIESSQAYGQKNGFPHTEYTTLPRMGAIKAILEEVGPREEDGDESKRPRTYSKLKLIKDTVGAIREKKYVKDTRPPIKYILDVTIAYPHGIPLTLATIAMGTREKCDIGVHYRVYDAEEVPFEDDDALRDWMYARYKEKDDMLGRYYETGEFFHGETGQRVVFSWSKIILQYIFCPS
ncbi:unnamed protein product, partial [Mesorhabditis spiculigera]